MNPKKLADDLYVFGQINPEYMNQLVTLGIRSIISNRPDGEAEGQPTFAEISREAHRYGMEVRYIPVVSGNLTEDDVCAFRSALCTLPRPILAYCRTGTRSTFLWALSEAPNRSMEEIATHANKAGYDLKNIEVRLRSIQSVYSDRKVEG